MREAYGHKIYTVEDLINELRQFDPTYEIGLNHRSVQGFSITGIRVTTEGIVDIYLQMSSDPALGLLEYDKFGVPVLTPRQKEIAYGTAEEASPEEL